MTSLTERADTRAQPRTTAERPAPVSWLRRPVVASLVLLAAYVALSFAMDPQGFLGTDTGGKVATLVVMSERGDLDPDVGYWAADLDPEAVVHGLYYTSSVGDRFVNVTTLPMVLAARPLYDLGGYRLTLLLPMAGAVASALAARSLVRRLGGDGTLAFWIVGLASPVAVYALDFWEHAPGLGLMAWAMVVLFDAVFDRVRWWHGLAAGALFGAAAAMRTEAFVYALTSVGLAILGVLWRRRADIVPALVIGATSVLGFGLAFGANLALERIVLGEALRSGRTSGAAERGLNAVGTRLEEALTTSFSPYPTLEVAGWVAGVAIFAALALAAARSRTKGAEGFAKIAFGLAVLVYLRRALDGLGFVPGLVAATPIAAVGLTLGWADDRRRFTLLLGLVPLPLVFGFQFIGGAAPQWAGRYLLVSGFAFLVVGLASFDHLARWLQRGMIALAVGVTAFGLVWLSQRSHDVADTAERLQSRSEDVFVTPLGFMPREFGATYGDARWLAFGPGDRGVAERVVTASDARTFAWVDEAGATPPDVPGWRPVSSETVPFLDGADLEVTTYERLDG